MQEAFTQRPCKTGKNFFKALMKQLQKLMKLTKQLITIIIVSFNSNKRFNYNKNRQKLKKLFKTRKF